MCLAIALGNSGELRLAMGDVAVAAELIGDSLRMCDQLGMVYAGSYSLDSAATLLPPWVSTRPPSASKPPHRPRCSGSRRHGGSREWHVARVCSPMRDDGWGIPTTPQPGTAAAG